MKNNKKLIIIKISGASLKGQNDIIDINFLNEIARQIKEISMQYKVAVVLGGGNIWRGNIASEIKMERYKADQMGMLATVMNSLALQSSLANIDVKANIFSTIEMEKIANSYIIRNLEESLNNNEIAILSCGTGRPYFTTDTGIAVSAAELHATYILMGKNNVDGVYDTDPNKNPNAVFFPHLTYSKAINDNLKVMDATAASICKQTNIKTIVFRINEPNGIVDALNLKNRFTLISEEPSDLDDLNFLKSHHIDEIKNNQMNNMDFSDEEVEKFLEEETPIFAKMSDEDIKEVEDFFKKVEEIAKNEKNLNNKSLNQNSLEQQKELNNNKDFASEFFTWDNKNEKNGEVHLEDNIENQLNDKVNLENNIQEQKNDIDLLNEIENEWLDVNKMVNELEIEEMDNTIFDLETNNDGHQKNDDYFVVKNNNESNQELNTKKESIKNNFLKDMDFYIQEIEKIKKNLIEGNKTKTKEIRESFDKKIKG